MNSSEAYEACMEHEITKYEAAKIITDPLYMCKLVEDCNYTEGLEWLESRSALHYVKCCGADVDLDKYLCTTDAPNAANAFGWLNGKVPYSTLVKCNDSVSNKIDVLFHIKDISRNELYRLTKEIIDHG